MKKIPLTKPQVILLTAIFLTGFTLRGCFRKPAEHAEANGHAHAETAEQAQIWTCSMHPQIRLPKPGKCPICGMDLIPLILGDEEETGARQISVSTHAVKLMEIETSAVTRRFVAAEVRMVGKVDYDETRVSYITAWVAGRLDHIFVDYTGIPVSKGDHMVTLYSPELLTAQEELQQAVRTAESLKESRSETLRDTAEKTITAAREKLRLWGLTAAQIAEIERREEPTDHITIYAPASGIVVHKNAQEGMYVQTGTKIYTIADLSRVWVKLDAYESDLSWLRYGQKVTFTTESLPGETLEGTIAFIDPVINPATRTASVRVNVDNPELKLKPGMFVRATAHPLVTAVSAAPGNEAQAPLVIPATAPLLTGTRAIVYVEVPDQKKPTYEGREIVLGKKAGDWFIVRHGLKEGERVVTRGNFKLDAELQIRAKPSMMTPEGGGDGGMHMDMGSEGKTGPQMSKEEMNQMESPFEKLPYQVRQQLIAVKTAAQKALESLDSGHPLEAAPSFRILAEALGKIDADALPAAIHAQWNEAAMFLGNDAAIGKTLNAATDLADLQKQLQTHLTFLEQRLGLTAAETPPPAAGTFGKELTGLVSAYLSIQKALATDQLKEAQEATQTARTALEAVPMEKLSGSEHMLWMKQLESLKTSLSQMSAAQDLDAFRTQFAALSETMAAVVKTFPPANQSLYRFHCPMALNNRGADWLQNNDQTANPYFGSAMLSCGDVTQQINAMNEEKAGTHE